ncbi:hypothetical protein ACFQ8Q_23485 [Streptomyces cyaneofuscatus]|uniref:hypothetical protein n=1 Tax=Streptomyces cyaneofuscatus TaxID=66883 RepID=UPI0036B7D0F8
MTELVGQQEDVEKSLVRAFGELRSKTNLGVDGGRRTGNAHLGVDPNRPERTKQYGGTLQRRAVSYVLAACWSHSKPIAAHRGLLEAGTMCL